MLHKVDVIFCEDTRVTQRLCKRYDIHTLLKSLHARTEYKKMAEVLTILKDGKDVAYVSDAGTPLISDPGAQLVREAIEAGVRVETIPGASAVTAALSIAGLYTNEFTFFGFLPHKKGRQTLLKEIKDMKRTAVVYESTHRVVKLLQELQDIGVDRMVCIARELTKIHEEVLRGTPKELQEILTTDTQKQKGEFVVLVAGL